MSGKLCAGGAISQPKLRQSKAYCQGRAAAIAGDTIDQSPYDDRGDRASNLAWYSGYYSAIEGAPEFFLRDCCAEPKGGAFGIATVDVTCPETTLDGTVGTWYPFTFNVKIDGFNAPVSYTHLTLPTMQ